jgi:hypothetical protein
MGRPEYSDETKSCATSGTQAWQVKGKEQGEEHLARSFGIEYGIGPANRHGKMNALLNLEDYEDLYKES